MRWFKRYHNYYVTYKCKTGFGSMTLIKIKVLNPLEFPCELSRLIESKENVKGVVIQNWIRL